MENFSEASSSYSDGQVSLSMIFYITGTIAYLMHSGRYGMLMRFTIKQLL